MPSAARALANRQNSLLSTGPVTAAGRAASSANALRHGLTSAKIVLPGEDPAEYDAFRQNLLRDYAPANDTERLLTEELAASSWRLLRARRVETAVLSRLIGDAPDPDTAIATLLLDKPAELTRLQRYVASIERAYYRALNQLRKLQAERTTTQKKNAVRNAWSAHLTQSEPPTTPQPVASFCTGAAATATELNL